MIRVECPSCGSRLNVKDELAGQTRNCPKCRSPITIPQEGLKDGPSVEPAARNDEDGLLSPLEAPRRLAASSRYLICDSSRLVATWEAGGQGWMLKANSGWVSAARNPDQLPNQGNFQLVELLLANTDDGLCLIGLTSYQLVPRWALTSLSQGEHRILAKITGPGHLGRQQKDIVRRWIMEQFMHPVWKDAENVLEYLANADYHSAGTE